MVWTEAELEGCPDHVLCRGIVNGYGNLRLQRCHISVNSHVPYFRTVGIIFVIGTIWFQFYIHFPSFSKLLEKCCSFAQSCPRIWD